MHPEPPCGASQGDSHQERPEAEDQCLQPGHVLQGAPEQRDVADEFCQRILQPIVYSGHLGPVYRADHSERLRRGAAGNGKNGSNPVAFDCGCAIGGADFAGGRLRQTVWGLCRSRQTADTGALQIEGWKMAFDQTG
jgi:hypothetical protein